MSLRSENARVEAKKLLIHYFELAGGCGGVGWEISHAIEIEMIVDLIIEAAHGEAEKLAERQPMTESRMRDLLAFFDSRLSDVMFSLSRTRQMLTNVQQQQRIGTDAVLLGHVGEALAAVREAERAGADMKRRTESVRHDTHSS